MTAPLPTKAQVVEEMRVLLSRELRRLAVAEAAGTLTPREAAVVARLRADMAASAAEQCPAA